MKVMLIIGMFFIVNMIIPYLMNAMNIEKKYYFNYLFLANIVFVFYLLLPEKIGDVFE